jgi:hypothetical protein
MGKRIPLGIFRGLLKSEQFLDSRPHHVRHHQSSKAACTNVLTLSTSEEHLSFSAGSFTLMHISYVPGSHSWTQMQLCTHHNIVTLYPFPMPCHVMQCHVRARKALGVEALAQGQKGQRSSNAEHQEVSQPFVLFRMVEIRHDARWRQHQHRDAVGDRIARHRIDEGAYSESQ